MADRPHQGQANVPSSSSGLDSQAKESPAGLASKTRDDFLRETLALEGAHGSLETCSDLPLLHVERLVKLEDPHALEVSAETPVLFARAIVMLVTDLAHVGWQVATADKRNTLINRDVRKSVEAEPDFDFLMDVVDGTLERELQAAEEAPFAMHFVDSPRHLGSVSPARDDFAEAHDMDDVVSSTFALDNNKSNS